MNRDPKSRSAIPDLRGDWDERYRHLGDSLPSVLPRGLPAVVNEYLDGYHGTLIDRMLSGLRAGGRMLDLGCGWGRSMNRVSSARPDSSVVGVDFSPVSCRLAKSTGLVAVQSDVMDLPFRDRTFDSVLAITVLMYVHEGLDDAVAELTRVLVPGGTALFIDPSREFERAARLLRRRNTVSTSGKGFLRSEMLSVLSTHDLGVEAAGSTIGLSLTLPAIMLMRSCRPALALLLRIASLLDRGLGRFDRFGFHRWIICRYSGTTDRTASRV